MSMGDKMSKGSVRPSSLKYLAPMSLLHPYKNDLLKEKGIIHIVNICDGSEKRKLLVAATEIGKMVTGAFPFFGWRTKPIISKAIRRRSDPYN